MVMIKNEDLLRQTLKNIIDVHEGKDNPEVARRMVINMAHRTLKQVGYARKKSLKS
jgi:hypothetical protein